MEEGICKGTIAAKVRNALAFYRPLDGLPGIEIRCHGTTLYNSIYRFDEEMLVNTHVCGLMAAHAPLLHLRRLSGGDLFETYSESFENVWNTVTPGEVVNPVPRRIDYYRDPDAPPANSIVVAVPAFILGEAGRLLMIQRTDNDLYSIPGGAQEVGETISQTRRPRSQRRNRDHCRRHWTDRRVLRPRSPYRVLRR